jgi:hypothetical protein
MCNFLHCDDNDYEMIDDGHQEPEAKQVLRDILDAMIEETYREIFALNTYEKQRRGLQTWYQYLNDTCTSAQLCIECKRQTLGA